MNSEDPDLASPSARPWRRFLPLAFLLAGLLLFFALGLDRQVGWDSLRENRQALLEAVALRPVRTALLFVALYATLVALAVPGASLLTTAGGFLFGPLLGAGMAVGAIAVGATCLFLAARAALGDLVRRRAGPAVQRLAAGFRRNALFYLLSLRLLPVFPSWLVTLSAGGVRMPARTFVLGTSAGIIPGAVANATFGNGLGAVLERSGQPDFRLLLQPGLLLPLAALALLALLPVLLRRWQDRAGLGGRKGSQ